MDVEVEGGVMNSEAETGRDEEAERGEGGEDNEDDEGEDEEEKGEEEEGGGGEEEDDGEGDGQEEEYQLRFDGEMDPLSFAEEDAFGLEPYQQFERLEYEALAERKRKALLQQRGDDPAKKLRYEDAFGANFDEIMETMSRSMRRKSRKMKKRGRRKGSKKKLSPEITRKLGDATLHYASGNYNESIRLLEEVVRLAPNLPDAYHTLGLVYNATGNRKKAMNFYMIAAHLTPKDPSLWKLLVAWSTDEENTGQVKYCLKKAITADPKDMDLRFKRALLYVKLGEYHKAAESYDQVVGLFPANIQARMMAAKMYEKCGQVGRAISLLEDYINDISSEADLSVVNILVTLLIETSAHDKALQYIEYAKSVCCSTKELPLYLIVKKGICQLYLGDTENAKILFQRLENEHAKDIGNLITEVADSLSIVGLYDSALKYYLMWEGTGNQDNGPLQLKIAQCYLSMKEREKAIPFFYKALSTMDDNVDARITLSSLLLEEDKVDEAVIVLSPPKHSESLVSKISTGSLESRPWWLNGRVRLQLAKIYHGNGMLEEFVDAIISPIRETLFIETVNEKVRTRRRLTKSDLFERVRLLDDDQHDSVFRGFRPIAASSELNKASRAKKLLKKRAAIKEERKAAALAVGLDWQSEESEDDSLIYPRKSYGEPPLPKLLKDEEHYLLILDVCKALSTLRRYWDALEIINHTLRLTPNTIAIEKKEELRALGAQISYNTTDPKDGYDCVRHIVLQHPYSSSAWNCYYKVVSRLEYPFAKHLKFLHEIRERHKDCVPPIIIAGHQFAIVRYQSAAVEYLQSYKLQPDDPLINLCVGTSLINLALGFRLKNKHLCILQGIAFLHKYQHICRNSQEALYNIARAYHQVGHFTLAASYYEKVLSIEEKDQPIPKLPNENVCLPEISKPGYCNLRFEAAYNLHLIYKKSGALDLARQVLRNYCNP